ncbi:MAG: alpha/beta fold hydrolase [Melioribacteraceae bacterium]|nr:alpha/beta fold hydrolase [Melioribacteraceae bacterium]
MKEFYHKFYTQYLSRDFEMLVFGEAGIPLIIFPTSKGKYYEVKDYGLIQALENFVEEGKIKIYCPDSIDQMSWYNYIIHPSDRVKTHLAYERVILNDVIEFAKFETGIEKVGLAGCSFGAYHALNLALKYPDKFSSLICLSGTYDIKPHIFGFYDDDCYFNNPFDYMPNLNDSWYLDNIRKIKIIIGVGEHDFYTNENRMLSELLHSKHIEHFFEIRQNAYHDWPYWREMLKDYIINIL